MEVYHVDCSGIGKEPGSQTLNAEWMKGTPDDDLALITGVAVLRIGLVPLCFEGYVRVRETIEGNLYYIISSSKLMETSEDGACTTTPAPGYFDVCFSAEAK